MPGSVGTKKLGKLMSECLVPHSTVAIKARVVLSSTLRTGHCHCDNGLTKMGKLLSWQWPSSSISNQPMTCRRTRSTHGTAWVMNVPHAA